MMKRFWVGVALGLATMIAAAGCEPHRHRLRKGAETAEMIPGEAGAMDPSENMHAPKGFFKNNRLPGGLSSQASDIEKSLGVGSR